MDKVLNNVVFRCRNNYSGKNYGISLTAQKSAQLM